MILYRTTHGTYIKLILYIAFFVPKKAPTFLSSAADPMSYIGRLYDFWCCCPFMTLEG